MTASETRNDKQHVSMIDCCQDSSKSDPLVRSVQVTVVVVVVVVTEQPCTTRTGDFSGNVNPMN